MFAPAPSQTMPLAAGRAVLRGLIGWWRIVHLGALLLALALSPSSYRRDNRRALAHQLCIDTAPMLPGFTLLSALVSLVLIHIVVVTAQSYGLSRYALETLVRVLVLELIPLTAALFVALRCTIPNGAELAELRAQRRARRAARARCRSVAARGAAAGRGRRVRGADAGRGQLRGRAAARLPRRLRLHRRPASPSTRAASARSSRRR